MVKKKKKKGLRPCPTSEISGCSGFKRKPSNIYVGYMQREQKAQTGALLLSGKPKQGTKDVKRRHDASGRLLFRLLNSVGDELLITHFINAFAPYTSTQ